MTKKLSTLLLIILMIPAMMTLQFCRPAASKSSGDILVGVEFMDHAAAAYVALDKKWYEKKGLDISTFDSYVTGMALSSAIVRGDVSAAYICLVPAINACANGGAPIKIVAGTHRYGYSLVVNSERIQSVKDMESATLGCVREGGAADILMRKFMKINGLNIAPKKILRMNPQKLVIALLGKKLDAAFIPGNWAAVAASREGFDILVSARDIWPDFQGSVLIVSKDLLKNEKEKVDLLVRINKKATDWINANQGRAHVIVAGHLQFEEARLYPKEAANTLGKHRHELAVTPEIIASSMALMEYSTDIDPSMIQSVIDFMYEAGYLKKKIKAGEIIAH